MSAENRPGVRPREEVWELCLNLSNKYGVAPLEILKRLVYVGEKLAAIEESGEGKIIWRKSNGVEEEIRVFSSNGHGNSNDLKL